MTLWKLCARQHLRHHPIETRLPKPPAKRPLPRPRDKPARRNPKPSGATWASSPNSCRLSNISSASSWSSSMMICLLGLCSMSAIYLPSLQLCPHLLPAINSQLPFSYRTQNSLAMPRILMATVIAGLREDLVNRLVILCFNQRPHMVGVQPYRTSNKQPFEWFVRVIIVPAGLHAECARATVTIRKGNKLIPL